ncbi:MAG: hypothetical protein ABS34_11945 [Opitutaceae bacterium BACL24 MAG-120322-bin51]|nr:MAG: hypothetical protein ABS34_11945 [Opitutaceae bacterium BACL24 MAG-120322-bin51]
MGLTATVTEALKFAFLLYQLQRMQLILVMQLSMVTLRLALRLLLGKLGRMLSMSEEMDPLEPTERVRVREFKKIVS